MLNVMTCKYSSLKFIVLNLSSCRRNGYREGKISYRRRTLS